MAVIRAGLKWHASITMLSPKLLKVGLGIILLNPRKKIALEIWNMGYPLRRVLVCPLEKYFG